MESPNRIALEGSGKHSQPVASLSILAQVHLMALVVR